MSTKHTDSDESSDGRANLRDVGAYEYRQDGRSYVWEHSETGLKVTMSRSTGLKDGRGNYTRGYTALARTADGDVVDEVAGTPGFYLPAKADAWRSILTWLEDHPDGEVKA